MESKNIRIKNQFLQLAEDANEKLVDEQRLVLDVFCQSDRHFTVTDIKEELKKQGYRVSTALIKDTLEMFRRYGIAQRRQFADKEPYYEHRHLAEHHDHMICIKCGRIMEFASDVIERRQQLITQRHSFQPLWHRLEIYGVCEQCAGEKKAVMLLSQVPAGAKVKFIDVRGGWGVRKRLADMGLIPGVELEVLNDAGPFVVAIKTLRLVIGFGMAQKILVSRL